jgi:hypothetical protein
VLFDETAAVTRSYFRAGDLARADAPLATKAVVAQIGRGANREFAVVKINLATLAAAACCALAAGVAPADAQTKYRVIDLGGGIFGPFPTAIWNGQVVGGDNSFPDVNCGLNEFCSVSHAKFWPSATAAATDLNPLNWQSSVANGISLGREVGTVQLFLNPNVQVEPPLSIQHAGAWVSTAASFVDINPPGMHGSAALGISGLEVVGYTFKTDSSPTHATLWELNLGAIVDLNPAGFEGSTALATAGGQQVGSATNGASTFAFLWHGTAASAVNLNPAGVAESFAQGTDKQQQVGQGDFHAYLWTGTAASAIDLNPPGFGFSTAFGVRGGIQVGFGNKGKNGNRHALRWSGSASSFLDLHRFLPAHFDESFAQAIDAHGNIAGIASDFVTGDHAVVWQPIR